LRRACWWTLLALTWITSARAGASLVLMFDDDCRNWIAVAAPELARFGGRATAYLNNECVHRGEASFADVRRLRDEYGWEIGTHTWHHEDATRLSARIGIEAWLARELDRALVELRAEGIHARTLAFPFNRYTPQLLAAVRSRVSSVRGQDVLPLAAGPSADGTFPSAAIDMNHHVPFARLRAWVDAAARDGLNLYLYAHAIEPDEAFASGTVSRVGPYELGASVPLRRLARRELCLVPDVGRHVPNTILVDRIEGSTVRAAKGDLRTMTRPGANFLVGPCYSTRLADFRALLGYAAPRLGFATVSASLARSGAN